jgi:FkbM family methyltransferase
MKVLHRVARAVRHAPGLRRLDRLWDLIRPAYHRTVNAFGRGVPLRCGPLTVRVPAEFSGLGWEGYEPESVTVFVEWIRKHPTGLVLDVGSSVGLMSLLALVASDAADVVAFDADRTSLALIDRLTRHAPKPGRVRRVLGLLSAEPTDTADVETAMARTAVALDGLSGRVRYRDIRYVYLDGKNDRSLPVYSLDALFAGETPGRPALLKIDVEGAELLVLRGAGRFVLEWSPAVLVSIHPDRVGGFGHTAADVRTWLTDRGYRMSLLAVDHEEHWWCVRDEALPGAP